MAIHADIEKMYRMVKVNPAHQKYQKIFWRDSTNEPLDTYALNTVTYGTASASFSAIRSLQKLVFDEGHKYPLAAAKASNDFYVDDLLSGANSVSEVTALVHELTELLKLGKFQLHKWYSNKPEVFNTQSSDTIVLDSDQAVKTLGMLWHPCSDVFLFSIQPFSCNIVTKRSILSEIGKIFDRS